jgi:membrane protease YdiL (CAAX protease family)
MVVAFFILVFYTTVRIGLNSLWETVNPLYSYLFEVIFVSLVYWFYRTKKNIKLFAFENKLQSVNRLIPWLPIGYIVYRLAVKAQIVIPFEFNTATNILLLLVVAPILEEFIFRLALWEAMDEISSNKELQIWVSSILFSVGHLISMFILPPEYRQFILYQAVYVVILGIGSSKMRQESKGIIGSILVHFLFNLGFYLGSLA